MTVIDVEPVRERDVERWDFEADVVVAGYGMAGVCAAIAAAQDGADVLVLERTGGGGGAAAMAAGHIYIGGGTRVQKACGFEDSPANMRAFLEVALGPEVDSDKLGVYCEGSVAHFDWLESCGVPFNDSFWGEPGWEAPFDDGLQFTGGENSAPFNTIATPAARGHIPAMAGKQAGTVSAGFVLMNTLLAKAAELGVRVEADIRAQRLITDDAGRVVGTVARRRGADVRIRARRGVVLATGGFAYNDEMVKAYAPRLYKRPTAAIEEHDGRSILMAQALGADLAHMDATEVAIFGDPQQFVRGILVNGRGQRFVPEDTYPGRIGQLALLHNDNQAILVLDEAAHAEAQAATSSTPHLKWPPTWVCESVAELEAEIGLPAGTLTATVDVYNEHAARGVDPVLGKKAEWLRPIGTPVAAIDLRGKTGGFTLGGLRTSVDSEVMHVSGAPVAGLYAAGRATAGLASWGYCSGISLGDSSFFGRRAGQAAAQNETAG